MRIKIDKFQARLLVLLGVSALLCVSFGALTLLQGPRFRSSTIDITQLPLQSGQRVVLRANQPLGNITNKQVSVSPNVPLQVSASGTIVVLQFSQRLAYDTRYTVTVKPPGLKSLQYAFTTEQPQVYYLHQEGISTADAILSRSLGGGLEKTVYKHADIASFIVVDNALIINVRNKDYSNSLYKLNLKNGKTTEIRLPKTGSVIQLQAAPSRKVFGFTFTSKGYEKNLNNILVTYNLSTGTLTKTNGFDKQPLQTLSWDFGPDSNTLLAQLYDNSTVLATADNTAQPLPLGQLAVGGLTPDGSKAIMSNSDGAIEVTLKSNAKRTLPMPTGLGTDTFVTTATPLNEGQGYMLYGQSFFKDHYGEYLIMHTKDADRHLYVSGKTESIASFALSPNDRYAAIDTLLFANGVSKHHLHVIDTQTGKSVLTSDGGAPVW